MKASLPQDLDDIESSSNYFKILERLKDCLAEYSVLNPYQIIKPLAKDKSREMAIRKIIICYQEIYQKFSVYCDIVSKQLRPSEDYDPKIIKELMFVDNNVISLIKAFHAYDASPVYSSESIIGYKLYGWETEKEAGNFSLYDEFYKVRENTIDCFKRIASYRTCRDEEVNKNLFDEELENYSLFHRGDAYQEYHRLLHQMSPDDAEYEFLKEGSALGIVQLFRCRKGSIGQFFNDIKGKKYFKQDIGFLLDYEMRRRIVEDYRSGKQVYKMDSLSVDTNLPPFAQYVIDPTIAASVLKWLHLKIDCSTKADIVLTVLKSLFGSILFNEIPYEDFIKEFPSTEPYISRTTYSKKKGPGIDIPEPLKADLIEACYSYIDRIQR